MVDVKTFGSKEEMMEWLAEQRESIQQRIISQEQATLTYGSHAVRFWQDLIIFVEVVGIDILRDQEDPEVVAQIEHQHSHEGSLWCKCFSKIEVPGEFGYHHRSVLWPIPPEVFTNARAVHWDPDRMGEWARLDLTSAYYSMRNYLERAEQ